MTPLFLLPAFLLGSIAGYALRALRSHRRLGQYRRQQLYRRYVSDGYVRADRSR